MNSPLPNREIERPLGLDGRRQDRHGPRRRRGGLALLIGSLCTVGVAGAIALREQPFRSPAQTVVSTPEQASIPAETALEPARTPASGYPSTGGGASIIKVEPPAEPAGNGAIIVRDPSTLGQDPRLAHLPDREMIEDSEAGPLPKRAADGRRPFDAYARPWSGARGARIAIIIGGLGVSQTGTQQAIAKLPPEVTLAFASGGNSLDRWMQQARQGGHEIIMQVPLEPFDYPQIDPGRNTLTVDAAAEENRDRLYWALSRITNYVGVMNYMGGRFVTDERAMEPLFGELAKRGLMYLDDGSSARSIADETAKRAGVPFAANDIAIDGDRDRGAILRKLDDLERTARAKGFAIGSGSAFDVTVDAVAHWVQEARRRGIEIVPVSAIATDPERG